MHPLQQAAINLWQAGHYIEAGQLYEQLIELEPEELSHYWHLGLAYLLTEQEAAAQMTWAMAVFEQEQTRPEQTQPDRVNLIETLSLATLLDQEAIRQEAIGADASAWLIRLHLQEIVPDQINNRLHLIRLAVPLNRFDPAWLQDGLIDQLLASPDRPNWDAALALQTAMTLLSHHFPLPEAQSFTEAVLTQVADPALIVAVLTDEAEALDRRSRRSDAGLIAYLVEICLRYESDSPDLLKLLSVQYETLRRYEEAVTTARRYLEACRNLEARLMAIGFLCLRLLKVSGGWTEVRQFFEQQKALINELVATYQPAPDHPLKPALLSFCGFYPYYLHDQPIDYRLSHNQLAQLLQTDICFQAQYHHGLVAPLFQSHLESTSRKLRVGYLARYMIQHSVGWLARWLMQYHDRDQFDIYTYHLHVPEISTFTDRWFVQPVTRSVQFADTYWTRVAQQIQQDKIDILVDLDSITYTETCRVMALKPAPIQVSWLGCDASGLPAIDYFLADPYVLPDHAQSYYAEQIWRLPHTYIAVDGFEVGIPTRRREELNIPRDGIVYFSAQDGRKRHPDTLRLQLQILQAVPHSYLLLKGLADEASLQTACAELAAEVGISFDRLRFLERDPNEVTHRANLSLADVVLDTFPYNGATTTLETLWMGIPIVTKVGQQFVARNSYTMLMNVGVTTGIAWNDREYIEWGIRLGTDLALRQQVATQLRQARRSAPLWNTAEFTRSLEAAYRQMWQIYRDSN
ncbi:MAG: O-linked N-acetylglucosamine transferase, SPINDLY family protein [Elainella sp. Prado103]|jgi:predicted O-linked N-acetylglucosamine transferase (SPINDLY family)|nr:O-linked N-acetylglucosamine transferase, SPINDLY family protein [Elainella sp. Prado103]